MVYAGGSKIILFGGDNSGTSNNETWEYDTISNSWTQITTTGVPTARITHAMVYTGNNTIILFGGIDTSFNDETWNYNIISQTWTNLTPTAPLSGTMPDPRSAHAMVYTGNNRIILFGGVKVGSVGIVYDEETWEYK